MGDEFDYQHLAHTIIFTPMSALPTVEASFLFRSQRHYGWNVSEEVKTVIIAAMASISSSEGCRCRVSCLLVDDETVEVLRYQVIRQFERLVDYLYDWSCLHVLRAYHPHEFDLLVSHVVKFDLRTWP